MPLMAADSHKLAVEKGNAATEAVDMFAALEKGQIEVQFFPRDSTQGRLVVTNKTDRPISVALPPALAATPVLAQFNNPAQAKQKAPQPVGLAPPINLNPNNLIGRNNAGPNLPGANQLGPLFNIPPEKTGQMKVKSVCLQPERAQPNPRIVYEVKPLATVCSKPELYEVCRLLGDPNVNQKALQAAAWHYANGLSWETLASKRMKNPWGPSPLYFTKSELQEGKRLAEAAAKTAEEHGKTSQGTNSASANR
jgi:hypothetical protein